MRLAEITKAATTGLPMDTASRMERAAQMGFNTKAYHGTGASFKEFTMGSPKSLSGPGPHFSDTRAEAAGYAAGRKQTTGKGKTLSVLLRIKRPYVIDAFGPAPAAFQTEPMTADDHKALVGKPHDPGKFNRKPSRYDTLTDLGSEAYDSGLNYGTAEHWAEIYRRLREQGYDALVWTSTIPDHSDQRYSKIVMLDTTGIRLTSATFDPAKSESRGLSD